jgi:outer membrane biogenesis lipoprotein LolB
MPRLQKVLAFLLLAGCVRVPPRDLSRDPAQLARQVSEAQGRVRSVRGSARVTIASPGLSGTLQELAAAEKPDRVRLETVDFFGNPAALLVAADGRFAFLDQRAGVFYRGDATPENVSRLLPVVLPVEELVTILCGSAPLLPGGAVDVTAKQDLLVLTIASGDTTQQIAIGEAATVAWSRVRRTVTGAGGERREIAPAYDLEFHVFERTGGLLFPTHVRLDAPAAGSRVDLEWRDDLEVNPTLERSLFHLEPPRGARVVDLARGQPIPPVDLPIEPPRRE